MRLLLLSLSSSSTTTRRRRKQAPPTFLVLVLVFVVGILLFTNLITSSLATSTSRLQVHIPASLNSGTTEGYDHRDALFGIPPYGGSIQETVYYTTESLCSGPPVTNGTNNQSSTSTKKYFPDTKGKPWTTPFILMVDRGDCTFVQKVRNAQKGGAAAVIIADNECQCGAVNCSLGPAQVCETQEPIMADDGSGSDISIPSFLMFKQDADVVKEVLFKNQPVRIEMSFSVPAPDSRVEYDLWTTPKDPVSRNFLKSFEEAAIAFGDRAYFTPRNYIYDGGRAGCQDSKGVNQCFTLCTNEGKYCATDPDDDMTGGISGADVVTESLRRICIWNLYGKDDGIGVPWWDYVKEFMYRCDDPDKPGFFNNDECISDAMNHAKVDVEKVNQCMTDSGGLEGNVANKLFDEQLADKESSGAFLIPSLFINQAPIRGELVYSTVFRAICAGYASGYEPTICKQCSTCSDPLGCVEQSGRCTAGSTNTIITVGGGVSATTFAASLAVLSVLFLIIFYCHYVRQQRLMNEQIRGIVAEYMPVGADRDKSNSLALDEDEGFT